MPESGVNPAFFGVGEPMPIARFLYMRTYLREICTYGLGCGLDVICCGTRIDVIYGANSI